MFYFIHLYALHVILEQKRTLITFALLEYFKVRVFVHSIVQLPINRELSLSLKLSFRL